MRNVVIACGGTGHLTPGIALAQSLEERGCPSWLFIGKNRSTLDFLKNIQKLSFQAMPGSPLIKSQLDLLGLDMASLSPLYNQIIFIERVGADAMVGFGGFSSLDQQWQHAQGMPIFIHEANRAVGKAVKFLVSVPLESTYRKGCDWRESLLKSLVI